MLLLSLNCIAANNEKNQKVTAQHQEDNVTDFILLLLLQSDESDWYDYNYCRSGEDTRVKLRDPLIKKKVLFGKKSCTNPDFAAVKFKSNGLKQKSYYRTNTNNEASGITTYWQISGADKINNFRKRTDKFSRFWPGEISFLAKGEFLLFEDECTSCEARLLHTGNTHEKRILMAKCTSELSTQEFHARLARLQKKEVPHE